MTLVWIVLGIFIGWNVDQPAFAKNLQESAKAKWKEFRSAK